MKKKNRWIIWVVAGLLAVGLVAVLVMGGRKSVVLNTAVVAESDMELTVMATGYIQPVEEVEVGTQVSGVIEKIYVDYNSHVTKGQLLAELDKLTLQEKLNQSRASMTSAQSDLSYAQQNFDRTEKLYKADAATQVAYEEALNRLNQAKTQLDNARANLNQAEVNLSYANIYSPIDGVVLDRSVNTGQTVAASFSTPTLFTIAEDLTKMQVEADVDEADIGQVKVGQPVTFTVDAYNNDVFEGTVSQIRLQPKVTSNVVTYTVIVDAPNPEEKLFPGMTANITIEVQAERGLTVPVEAVNFRMTQEVAKGLKISYNADAPRTKAGHRVWVMTGGKPEQRTIETGINDGINYIVKSGLKAGDEVVLSAHVGKKENRAESSSASLFPRPSGGGNRGGGAPRM